MIRIIRRITWLLCAAALQHAAAAQGAVDVEIRGLSGAELENVRARLQIRRQANREGLDEALVERLHRDAPDDIREALQPFGYYSPRIEATLTGSEPNWQAVYEVLPGPATQLQQIDIDVVGEGKGFEPIQEVIAAAPLARGQRLLHQPYETTKSRILRTAYEQGFLDARWQQAELRVDPEGRRAAVALTLDTGPRYAFGEVTIEQDDLDDDFLRRYLVFEPGDPAMTATLLKQQFVYSDLGYFETVEIELQRERTGQDHRIPVVIHTTLRDTRRYEGGLGYGTDTGARATLGAEWRRLNRRGHRLNVDLRVSQIENAVGAKYLIPVGTEPDENLSLNAASEYQQLEDGSTTRYTLGASLLRSPGHWQRRSYIEYLHEETDFGREFVTSDLFMPGIAFTRASVDDPIRTRRGWYLFADLHGAQELLLSTASFVQMRGLGRAVYPLADRLRLLGRAELGATWTDEFEELPASQRFFAGGDQSVRGYQYRSLGTTNEFGEIIGGQYLTVLSLETEYQVTPSWAAALFVDSGGANDDPGRALHTGVGVGIRYAVPVGDLRLDIAHPLDDDEPAVRIHFGIRVGL